MCREGNVFFEKTTQNPEKAHRYGNRTTRILCKFASEILLPAEVEAYNFSSCSNFRVCQHIFNCK